MLLSVPVLSARLSLGAGEELVVGPLHIMEKQGRSIDLVPYKDSVSKEIHLSTTQSVENAVFKTKTKYESTGVKLNVGCVAGTPDKNRNQVNPGTYYWIVRVSRKRHEDTNISWKTNATAR